jgi:hypothetical protein
VAGFADSELTLAAPSAASLTGTVTATGGQGGITAATPSAGGAATAIINLTGANNVFATATANGGSGGGNSGTGSGASGGAATANASAISTSNLAKAVASGTGGFQGFGTPSGPSGPATATARAQAGAGLFAFVQNSASSSGSSTSAQGWINQGQAAPTFSNAGLFNAASYTVTAPITSDITSRWTSNVKNAFGNNTTNVNVLGLANLVYSSLGSGAPEVYNASLDINETNALLTANDLLLGFATPQGIGTVGGGDAFRFRLLRNATPLVDQTFTSTAALNTYFTNTVLDLGLQNADLNGANLDLQVLVNYNTSHTSTGYGVQFLLGTVAPQARTWNNASGGSWASPVNWTGSIMPEGPGASAVFGNVIGGPRTISLDQNITVGSITFNSPNTYTIIAGSPVGMLTLDNAGAPANITVITGNHTISAPMALTPAGATLTVPAASSLALSANISGGGLTLTGNGTVKFIPSSGTARLTSLTLPGAPGAWTGTFDITNNPLIIEATAANKLTTLATLQDQVAFGLTHNAGITSSTTTADPAHKITVVIDNALLALTQFNGAAVDANSLLIESTWFGDSNLDRKVDVTDLGTLATHYGQSTTAGPLQGDFNNDGHVDVTDLGLLATNYGQGTSNTPFSIGNGQSALGNAASVPEPTSLLLALPIALLLPRARRLRTRLAP